MSADLELGLVYVPVEMPTGDYYGGNRPGNTLFDESLVALDIKTGKRKWHYQTVHHGVWDYDLAVRADPVRHDRRTAGASRRWRSRPSRRSCSCSIARPASRSGRSRSGRCRSRRCRRSGPARRSRSRPSRRRSIGRASSIDDLIDFTPALRAEALEVVKRYKIGPLYTPPVAEQRSTARSRRCRCPPTSAARTGPAARSIRKRNRLYIHSHTAVFLAGIVPANPRIGHRLRRGQARAGGAGDGVGADGRAGGAAARAPAARGRGGDDRAGPAAHQAALRSHHRLRHEHGRHRLAEDAQLDAGRHQEPSGAARAEPAAPRPAGPHLHRHADDEDAADRRRRRRAHATRPASASRCCAPTTRRPARTSARSRCRTSRPARR